MPSKKYILIFKNLFPIKTDEKYGFLDLFSSTNTNTNTFSPPLSSWEMSSLNESTNSMNSINSTNKKTMDTLPSTSRQSSVPSLPWKEQKDHHSSISSFSFFDESKKDHQCVVTMTRSSFPQSTEPSSPEMHCFWCRHTFQGSAIGCPLRYNAHRFVKTYESEITKDLYTLRESITPHQLQDVGESISLKETEKNGLEEKWSVQPRDYFTTDGIFCSFNCALAFILENKTNPLYVFSINLLHKMYQDSYFGLHGKSQKIPLLDPAPSWRLLKSYGGHMSIEEFRKNFSKIKYTDIDNIMTPFPNAKPVGFVFEKQVCL